mgnify:FL=1
MVHMEPIDPTVAQKKNPLPRTKHTAARDYWKERGKTPEAKAIAMAEAIGEKWRPYEDRLLTRAGCVELVRSKLALAYEESDAGSVESLRVAEHLRKMLDSTKEYMVMLESSAEEKMGELEEKITLVVNECMNLREERDNLLEAVKELERRVGVQTAAGVDGIEQEAT